MKRLTNLVIVAFAFAAVVVASAFGAGGKSPHNQPITASCTTSGNVTVHASSGQSAWVNNTHWVVLSFSGQFTPAGGTPGPVMTKVYGHKNGLVKRNTAQSCKGSQTDAAGNTFTFTATVARTTR